MTSPSLISLLMSFCLIPGMVLGAIASMAFMVHLPHLLTAAPVVVSGIGF